MNSDEGILIMKISELADLFNVSTEKLLKTIASEVYEVDVEFFPDELPEEVLEIRKIDQEPPEDPSPEDGSSNVRSVATNSNDTNTFVRQLLEQGKIGLGFVVILANGSDRRAEQIRSELRDLGEAAVRESIGSVTSIIRKNLEDFRNKELIEQYFSGLPGISSIFLSVANRCLDEQPVLNWKPKNREKPSKTSSETSEF